LADALLADALLADALLADAFVAFDFWAVGMMGPNISVFGDLARCSG
jgi:hypothetical protein